MEEQRQVERERYQRQNSNYKKDKKPAEDSFFEKVRQSYEEVKKEEKKDPFVKRHRRWNRHFEKEFGRHVDNVPKFIAFELGNGLAHVSLEFIYQLYKLKNINEDSVTKFVIRNRRALATVLAGFMIASFVPGKGEATPTIPPTPETTVSQPAEDSSQEVAYLNTMVLNRHYTIRFTDTLSQLAEDSGVRQSILQDINNISNPNSIQMGQAINIPYEINSEDLQYYVQSVNTEGRSIYDIANEYETDADTIARLNEEAITVVNGAYVVTSDTLLVPNFITRSELRDLKSNTMHN